MIDAISHANVWVDDQDEAKTFYTEKLGFEVRRGRNARGVRRLSLAHRRAARASPTSTSSLSAPTPPAIDSDIAKQVMELV